MASKNKVSYANLKLKIDTDVNTFDFQGQKVEVLKYLPVEDKYDLVMITLQKAKEDGVYNPLKLDIFFHLHLVYMYTNLSFTDKQRENELRLYDCLVSNGFVDKLVDTISENEYNYLFNMINEIVKTEMKYKNSAAGVIHTLVQDLPANAEAAAQIVDSFDPNKYQAVIDFAEAANGGRPIRGLRTNMQPVDDAK